jgi:phosphoglycolate phosphatase-like HAD superfamily hydrolase
MRRRAAPLIATLLASLPGVSLAADALPSWNDTAPKQAVVAFVERVTNLNSLDYVAEPERIAVFDNDGTLWAEQPIYVQAYFMVDRIRAEAPHHPEWQSKEPFASLIKGDLHGVAAAGEAGLAELFAATHAGMTTDEFSRSVTDWIGKARHPKTGKLYTEMAYRPMLELLDYLRANGFKTFIVSGSGIEFMRPWSERVYGIPPEQVVGTTGGLKFEMVGAKPVMHKLPELAHLDDKEGKPVAIQRHIGRRPIAAFGNSDGDLAMLQWTCQAQQGPRLCLYVHHTDGEREWAYDRTSKVGRLDKGLDAAQENGWTVVSMKEDWKKVFAFE